MKFNEYISKHTLACCIYHTQMFVYPPICRLSDKDDVLHKVVKCKKSTEPGAGRGLFARRNIMPGVYMELSGFVPIKLSEVEQSAAFYLHDTSLAKCVKEAGLGTYSAELFLALAHWQYRDLDEATYTHAMQMAERTKNSMRFPLFVYCEMNVATIAGYHLDPKLCQGLRGHVERAIFAPGHVDLRYFVQGVTVQELLWVFALCTQRGVKLEDVVRIVALVRQNHFSAVEVHNNGQEYVKVVYLAPLMCSANMAPKESMIKCAITPVYRTTDGPVPAVELSAHGVFQPTKIKSKECLVGTALVVQETVLKGEELFFTYANETVDPENQYRFVGELGKSQNGFVWELLQPSCPVPVRDLAKAVLQHEAMALVLCLARSWAEKAGLGEAAADLL